MMVPNSTIRSTKRKIPTGIGFCCAIISSSLVAEQVEAQMLKPASSQGAAATIVEASRPADLPTPAQLTSSGSTRIASRKSFFLEPQFDTPPIPDPAPAVPGATRPADSNPAAIDSVPNASNPSLQDTVAGSTKTLAPNIPRQMRLEVTSPNTNTEAVGTGLLPDNIAAISAPSSIGLPDGAVRGMATQQVYWQPADVCHFPVYFEDAMLERHGHVRWGHAQPVVSGVKFLSTIPILPYLTTMHPPCEPRYNLGHFRPGTCAPVLMDHVPWDRRAATVQALSTAGFWVAAPL
jgi:hypothetical protein